MSQFSPRNEMIGKLLRVPCTPGHIQSGDESGCEGFASRPYLKTSRSSGRLRAPCLKFSGSL